MLPIPAALQTQFEAGLCNQAMPKHTHGLYKKWLRYYLDFCHKYHLPQAHKDSLDPFFNKLQEKKQTQAQQQQASQAIALYYELIHASDAHHQAPSFPKDHPAAKAPHASRIATRASWKAVYTSLAREIQVRHYSPKTLKSYARWVRQFQNFTGSKDPTLLDSSDVTVQNVTLKEAKSPLDL